MTDPSKPGQIIELAIVSSQAFSAIYPEFIFQYSLPSNATKAYNKEFLETVHKVLFSKSYQPLQKFYAMYLLFKASEREGQACLMSQLVGNNELLSEIFRIAQTDLCKDILPNERGKTYFGKPQSRDHAHIAMNLVRLCYEAAIYWGSKYGVADAQSPMHIYFFLADTLRKKGKQPFRYFFIDKDYDLSTGIATWDFRRDLPPQIKPKKDQDEGKKPSNSLNTSLEDIADIDEDDQDGLLMRLGSKNSRTNSKKTTRSVPLVIKSHKKQQQEEHIKARIARLEAILKDLNNTNQIDVSKSKSLDNLEKTSNMTLEEIDKSQSIPINSLELDITQPKHSRRISGNLESTLEGIENTKDLKRAKEIEKELCEIQMSIANSCGVKKKLNPFYNPKEKRNGYPSSLQALPSENKTKDVIDEVKFEDEYNKFMNLRLAKLVTFGEEVTNSGLLNTNSSGLKLQHTSSTKANENLERVYSFGHIDLGLLRLESKNSIVLPSIQEEKQCKSLILPGEDSQTKKHDPFSKAPIPDQRIPENYKITEVVVVTEGRPMRSTIASRDFDSDKQTAGSLNELKSESEAVRPTHSLQIQTKDRVIHSLPNLDAITNTERKRVVIIKPFSGYQEKSTAIQDLNQRIDYITKGI